MRPNAGHTSIDRSSTISIGLVILFIGMTVGAYAAIDSKVDNAMADIPDRHEFEQLQADVREIRTVLSNIQFYGIPPFDPQRSPEDFDR